MGPIRYRKGHHPAFERHCTALTRNIPFAFCETRRSIRGGTQWRCVLLRSLCKSRPPAGECQGAFPLALHRLATAESLRGRQKNDPSTELQGVPGAGNVQRRMPQKQVYQHPRRGIRTQLPLRRVQAVLQTLPPHGGNHKALRSSDNHL